MSGVNQSVPEGGLSARLHGLHRRWADQQNLPEIQEGFGPASWGATLLVMAGIIALGAYVPGARDFFRLDPRVPSVHLAVSGLLFLIASGPVRQATALTPKLTVLITVVGLNFDLYLLSLILFSEGLGSVSFGYAYLIVRSQSGHLYRATVQAPVTTGASLLAALFSIVHVQGEGDAARLVFFVFAGLAGHLLAGVRVLRADRERAESDRLRSALLASQMAEEQARLSARLFDVLGANHDLRNAVNAAMLSSQIIRIEIGKLAAEEPSSKALRRLDQLESALQRVTSIVTAASQDGLGSASPRSSEPVEIRSVLDEARAAVERRFPRTTITLETPQAPVYGLVRGGRLSLHRALENLLLNACEGDGATRATSVRVTVAEAESGRLLRIVVRDDGPGFKPEQLAEPIRSFETSKAHGTGLGLFTSERVMLASGGSLERRNGAGGGAEVEILLPQSDVESPGLRPSA